MPTKAPHGNLDRTSFKSSEPPASSSPPGGGSIARPRRGLAAVQVIRADAHGRHDEQEDHDLDDDMLRLSQRTANHRVPPLPALAAPAALCAEAKRAWRLSLLPGCLVCVSKYSGR
jgi:hypothetical protein